MILIVAPWETQSRRRCVELVETDDIISIHATPSGFGTRILFLQSFHPFGIEKANVIIE